MPIQKEIDDALSEAIVMALYECEHTEDMTLNEVRDVVVQAVGAVNNLLAGAALMAETTELTTEEALKEAIEETTETEELTEEGEAMLQDALAADRELLRKQRQEMGLSDWQPG